MNSFWWHIYTSVIWEYTTHPGGHERKIGSVWWFILSLLVCLGGPIKWNYRYTHSTNIRKVITNLWQFRYLLFSKDSFNAHVYCIIRYVYSLLLWIYFYPKLSVLETKIIKKSNKSSIFLWKCFHIWIYVRDDALNKIVRRHISLCEAHGSCWKFTHI